MSSPKPLGRISTPNPSDEGPAANVETILRFHDVMEAGDRDRLAETLLEFAHPEVEWRPLVTGVEGGVYRGRDGVLAFFDDFLGSFEVDYRDRELRAIGDQAVLMLCTMAVRGRGSGAEVAQEMGVVYEFEGRLVRRGRAYPGHAAAIAAAEELAAR